MLPNIGLNVCAYFSNCPSPENEYLKNLELAKMLGLDNYTIENYVVGLRSRVGQNHFFNFLGIRFETD